MNTMYETHLNGKNVDEYEIEILEERRGVKEDNNPTYNTFAGIGYELDDDNKRTGRIIAWAGNGSDKEVEVVESLDLDEFLNAWDSEWKKQFKLEGIL